MGYYVLVKRKGAKSWLGAIPAKKNVGKSTLRKSVSKNIKKGFTYRIVTKTEFDKLIRSRKTARKSTPKRNSSTKSSRKTGKKRIKRTKTRRVRTRKTKRRRR